VQEIIIHIETNYRFLDLDLDFLLDLDLDLDFLLPLPRGLRRLSLFHVFSLSGQGQCA
jgi:hypothetical protein